MLLNWNCPPELDAPRRRQMRCGFANRLKLERAKAKRAKGKKNHSTNKERSHFESLTAASIAKSIKAKCEAREAHIVKVRAYWLGQRPDHP